MTYLDKAIVEMESDEFGTGSDVGFDCSFDLAADNVGETRASLVVEGFSELGKRASKQNTHKEKQGCYFDRPHFFCFLFEEEKRWDW